MKPSNKNKKDLRQTSKLIRAKLQSDGRICEISQRIIEKIRALEDFKCAKNVMLFYPKEGEINLLGLLKCVEAEGKNFYLPRCEDCQDELQKEPLMSACLYREGDSLSLSKYNIPEPTCEALGDVCQLDIIFVPALCADKSCNRIGYGAGYYDNFFKKHKNLRLRTKKIIVLPLEMCVEKIDPDEHDIPCDMVISED